MRLITCVLLFAGCSSPEKPPITTSGPGPATSPPAVDAAPVPVEGQIRATVRIDADVGGKGFQGVWLHLAAGNRYVIAYRPRGYWKPFADQEVIVTGHCYRPYGQAISGQHFEVDTMRFFDPKQRGRGPILEVGPKQRMTGKLEKVAAPAGSKREGSSETMFVAGDKSFGIFGSDDKLDRVKLGESITIVGRAIVPDMSWTAQTGGDKIWIVDIIHDPDGERFEDTPMACP